MVIQVLHEEHDIFRMGGLSRKMPVVFYTFLIGSASLSALPLVTAGFFSKDQILWYAYSSPQGSLVLWLAGIAGAFLTALYSFRMVFIAFLGDMKTSPAFTPGRLMTVPLVILAVLSLVGGFIELPDALGNIHLFSGLLGNTLPAAAVNADAHGEMMLMVLSSLVALSGIFLAYIVYFRNPSLSESFRHSRLHKFFEEGWEFDRLYDILFVRPVVWLSVIDKKDFIDFWNISLAHVAIYSNRALSRSQNGKVRWYLLSLALGIAILLTYMLTK